MWKGYYFYWFVQEFKVGLIILRGRGDRFEEWVRGIRGYFMFSLGRFKVVKIQGLGVSDDVKEQRYCRKRGLYEDIKEYQDGI